MLPTYTKQIKLIFPGCQFIGYELKTPIKYPHYYVLTSGKVVREEIWSNVMRNGFLVTNCTQRELDSKKNETLIFRTHKSYRNDIKKLNMTMKNPPV